MNNISKLKALGIAVSLVLVGAGCLSSSPKPIDPIPEPLPPTYQIDPVTAPSGSVKGSGTITGEEPALTDPSKTY